VVTVGTYWAWETTTALLLLGGARGAGAPWGRRGAGAYRVATRTACYTLQRRMNGVRRCAMNIHYFSH